MARLLVALLAVCSIAGAVQAQCSMGDNACWCRRAGGKWRSLPSPLISTCGMTISWQGRARTANVYLPPGYTPAKRFPVWVQL